MSYFALHVQVLLIALLHITAQVSAQPYRALVAPITKDSKTSLYTITLSLNKQYVIDLDAPLSWHRCKQQQPRPIPCTSPICIEAQRYTYLYPSCPSLRDEKCTSCLVTPVNPVTKRCAESVLTYSNLIISRTNGRNPTSRINFKKVYLSCAPESLLTSLPYNASGVAGLSRANLSLSSQFTLPRSGISKRFALCLPGSFGNNGVIFFGGGPYYLLPPTNFDVSSIVSYTPLIKNPSSPGYYIDVNSISISNKALRIPSRRYKLDSLSHRGGVKLSTTVRYTTLRSDIYAPFLDEFNRATRFYPRIKPSRPFDLCVNASALGYTRVGLPVPSIDLGLVNGKNWTIFGSNSMIMIGDDVACLAFVDGGKYAKQAVVIGSFQIENNLLVFDLDQASIVGGVIEFIKELHQVLQALESKKQRKSLSPTPKPSPKLLAPPTPHQQQTPAITSFGYDSFKELGACCNSPMADVEAKLSGSNINLRIVARRIPGQVVKVINVLEKLCFEVLHLNISSMEDTVLYSFVVKIGLECQLSVEELVVELQQSFSSNGVDINRA